jgi:hypothetical protein
MSHEKDVLIVLDDSRPRPTLLDYTYQFFVQHNATVRPAAGDTFDLDNVEPFGPGDAFAFGTTGSYVDQELARTEFEQKPYAVPNPYVASASFEPARFAVSGRGDRRIEFRAIPAGATIRIYTVHGDLVRTLHQDGSTMGYVPWDLRTKDNLDVAPGLYVFHVNADGVGEHIGKLAIVK